MGGKQSNTAIIPQCALQIGRRKIDSNQRLACSSAKLGIFTIVAGNMTKGNKARGSSICFFSVHALHSCPKTRAINHRTTCIVDEQIPNSRD